MKKFLIGIRDRFINFDTFMHLWPGHVVNLFRWLTVTIFLKCCYAYANPFEHVNLFGGNFWLAKLVNHFVHIHIDIPNGAKGMLFIVLVSIWLRLFFRISYDLKKIIEPWIYLFLERKRIKKLSVWKVFRYSLLFPMFDIVGRYTTYIALFKKIEWKPVPHDSKVTIDDINRSIKS